MSSSRRLQAEAGPTRWRERVGRLERARAAPPTAAVCQVARLRGWRLAYRPPSWCANGRTDPESGWRVVDREGAELAGPWRSNTEAWAWITDRLLPAEGR